MCLRVGPLGQANWDQFGPLFLTEVARILGIAETTRTETWNENPRPIK